MFNFIISPQPDAGETQPSGDKLDDREGNGTNKATLQRRSTGTSFDGTQVMQAGSWGSRSHKNKQIVEQLKDVASKL